MKLKKGFIQIYTGNGKGKTTAAIGLAVRALGAGLKVYMVQFMKDYPYSELSMLKKFDKNFLLERFGNDRFVFQKTEPASELIQQMKLGLDQVKHTMLTKKYDLVILDEVLVSIFFKCLEEEDVINFINFKPEKVELVLTGRYCPKAIIELADLVTTMEETKHYYHHGVLSRPGIDA